ncbi:peptidase S41 [Clostridia bacterium]|nr:peptidase S41 [Clostridia bacterium]
MTDIHEEQKGKKIIKKILRFAKRIIFTILVGSGILATSLATYCFFYKREFVNFMLGFLAIKDRIATDYIGEVPPDRELYLGAYQGMIYALGDPHSAIISQKQEEEYGLLVPKKKMFGIVGELQAFEDNGNYYYKLGHINAGSQLEKAGFKVGDVIVGVNSFVVESEATKAELADPKITKALPNTCDFLVGLGDVSLVSWGQESVIWSETLLQSLEKEKLITPEQKKESQDKNVLIKVRRYNAKKKAFERFSASVAKEFFDIPSADAKLKDNNLDDAKPGSEGFDLETGDVWEDEDVGYIKLRDFDLGAGDVFETELNKVLKKGVKGLIIDLRGNPGGLVGECNKIISMFIKKGEICKEVDRKGTQTFTITKDITKTDIPIAVLVNELSASASEEFAAVMQTHKRGTVIGTKTFGKGVGQTPCSIHHGEMIMWLTTYKWFAMPGDVSVDKVGVTPDLEVPSPDFNNPDGAAKQDSQLAAAIKHLKENK